MGAHLRGAALAFAVAAMPFGSARASNESRPLQRVTCSLPNMLEDLRGALKAGSPAYRAYMAKLLREAALGLSAAELRQAFDRERDPAVLEALGAAMATKASNAADPRLLSRVLERVSNEADPELRAAALRGLRATGSVDTMERLKGPTYAQLIRDPAPVVREAVVGNLIEENAHVYSGHDKAVSEMAVSAAASSPDPRLTSKLLKEVSMEQVGPEAVQTLSKLTRSDSADVRSAAAAALGGVPGPEMAGARGNLVDLFKAERDPAVRKSILEAIVRLGFSKSLPALESLRGVDPALSPEIDAWTAALKTNLQEWYLLKREKERLQR